ncbi:hypothetical protein CMK14_21650 [Candidatus Poribacteria bacterium]|nr:hypothetical protein [Candidatus Poribacteria bacterium]
MVVAGTMEPQTQVHLSSLSDHQQTILHLLELPLATDSGLGVRFFQTIAKINEPTVISSHLASMTPTGFLSTNKT